MNQDIREQAELFREMARTGLSAVLAYDREGVQWLDGYIFRNRQALKENSKFQECAGCFFGECLRETYGGEWVSHADYGWGVKYECGVYSFPFNKILKHIANEDGDSILGMFDAIPMTFAIDKQKKQQSLFEEQELNAYGAIGRSLIPSVPEHWRSIHLELAVISGEISHSIFSENSHSESVAPSAELLECTQRLTMLFRENGRVWQKIKLHFWLSEGSKWNFKAEYE